MMKNFILFLLVFFLAPHLGNERVFPEEGKKSFFQLTVKGKKIRVEVVRTEEEKARGLMFRETLGKDEGMLFVYDREEVLSFWMKNTPLPLSIGFIDQRGKIVDLQDMEPFSLRIHVSTVPARYALEANRGWFKKNGIKVGDVIGLPPGLKK